MKWKHRYSDTLFLETDDFCLAAIKSNKELFLSDKNNIESDTFLSCEKSHAELGLICGEVKFEELKLIIETYWRLQGYE